jgi:hypothetical protein
VHVLDRAEIKLPFRGAVFGVGSDTGAVSAFLLTRFPCPPSEPDVRLVAASGSPRVHVAGAGEPDVSVCDHGVGMRAPRYR